MIDIIVVIAIILLASTITLGIYYDIRDARKKWKMWSDIQKGDVFLNISRYESPFKQTEITPIVILDKTDTWIQYKWSDDTIDDCRFESFFEFWGFVSLESYNANNEFKYHYEPKVKPKTTGEYFLK